MPASIDGFLPLTPLSLTILLTLSGRSLHGYAVMQEIAAMEGPRLISGAGSLYAALDRLVTDGLLSAEANEHDARRHRQFSTTSVGRQVAAAELRRLESVLSAGRRILQGGA